MAALPFKVLHSWHRHSSGNCAIPDQHGTGVEAIIGPAQLMPPP